MDRQESSEPSYGVLGGFRAQGQDHPAVEQIRAIGYAVVECGYTQAQIQDIAQRFAAVSEGYRAKYGPERLRACDELNTVRAILAQGDPAFLQLAMNIPLNTVLQSLIVGKFMLSQQNGIINPACETYNQAAWHRDLPYQHFVSSRPLALNALYCIDDFTLDNGCTFVLPASHRLENFPSDEYIRRNAVQVEAKAGSFVVLDCMLFHRGGYNSTRQPRRAVNHLFTVPYFKQQIDLPSLMAAETLTAAQKDFLGFNYSTPATVEHYLHGRGA
ncbi:hypothetical protein AUC61_12700 [Pseudomonas sp. S25]|uniref:Phytanoyl-CoA dioxygenase n=1 Tax=Pseudomonas maioricensis TaxID=1766623 RepID=A0ABS9ZNF6_9PSED|nr:phytanoyl-CoA dioxygenase family protein [Pseudomonas sp. S25]MCI8210398.1 hypothetical protein [Pseudomonas sp. S25]